MSNFFFYIFSIEKSALEATLSLMHAKSGLFIQSYDAGQRLILN